MVLISGHAGWYLFLLSAASLGVFLPMALFPLAWGTRLGWRLDGNPNLARYYGRCLGCVIVVIAGAGLYASMHPLYQDFFLAMISAAFAAMVLVHLYGGIMRIQPRSETLESGAWLLLLLATLWVWLR